MAHVRVVWVLLALLFIVSVAVAPCPTNALITTFPARTGTLPLGGQPALAVNRIDSGTDFRVNIATPMLFHACITDPAETRIDSCVGFIYYTSMIFAEISLITVAFPPAPPPADVAATVLVGIDSASRNLVKLLASPGTEATGVTTGTGSETYFSAAVFSNVTTAFDQSSYAMVIAAIARFGPPPVPSPTFGIVCRCYSPYTSCLTVGACLTLSAFPNYIGPRLGITGSTILLVGFDADASMLRAFTVPLAGPVPPPPPTFTAPGPPCRDLSNLVEYSTGNFLFHCRESSGTARAITVATFAFLNNAMQATPPMGPTALWDMTAGLVLAPALCVSSYVSFGADPVTKAAAVGEYSLPPSLTPTPRPPSTTNFAAMDSFASLRFSGYTTAKPVYILVNGAMSPLSLLRLDRSANGVPALGFVPASLAYTDTRPLLAAGVVSFNSFLPQWRGLYGGRLTAAVTGTDSSCYSVRPGPFDALTSPLAIGPNGLFTLYDAVLVQNVTLGAARPIPGGLKLYFNATAPQVALTDAALLQMLYALRLVRSPTCTTLPYPPKLPMQVAFSLDDGLGNPALSQSVTIGSVTPSTLMDSQSGPSLTVALQPQYGSGPDWRTVTVFTAPQVTLPGSRASLTGCEWSWNAPPGGFFLNSTGTVTVVGGVASIGGNSRATFSESPSGARSRFAIAFNGAIPCDANCANAILGTLRYSNGSCPEYRTGQGWKTNFQVTESCVASPPSITLPDYVGAAVLAFAISIVNAPTQVMSAGGGFIGRDPNLSGYVQYPTNGLMCCSPGVAMPAVPSDLWLKDPNLSPLGSYAGYEARLEFQDATHAGAALTIIKRSLSFAPSDAPAVSLAIVAVFNASTGRSDLMVANSTGPGPERYTARIGTLALTPAGLHFVFSSDASGVAPRAEYVHASLALAGLQQLAPVSARGSSVRDGSGGTGGVPSPAAVTLQLGDYWQGDLQFRPAVSFMYPLVGSLCGNGLQDTNETCDDGNAAAGDGCDAMCAVETGFVCSKPRSVCSLVSAAGQRQVTLPDGFRVRSSTNWLLLIAILCYLALGVYSLYKRKRNTGTLPPHHVRAGLLAKMIQENAVVSIFARARGDPFDRIARVLKLLLKVNIAVAVAIATNALTETDRTFLSALDYISVGHPAVLLGVLIQPIASIALGAPAFEWAMRRQGKTCCGRASTVALKSLCALYCLAFTAVNVLLWLGKRLVFPASLVRAQNSVLVTLGTALAIDLLLFDNIGTAVKFYVWRETSIFSLSAFGNKVGSEHTTIAGGSAFGSAGGSSRMATSQMYPSTFVASASRSTQYQPSSKTTPTRAALIAAVGSSGSGPSFFNSSNSLGGSAAAGAAGGGGGAPMVLLGTSVGVAASAGTSPARHQSGTRSQLGGGLSAASGSKAQQGAQQQQAQGRTISGLRGSIGASAGTGTGAAASGATSPLAGSGGVGSALSSAWSGASGSLEAATQPWGGMSVAASAPGSLGRGALNERDKDVAHSAAFLTLLALSSSASESGSP